MYILFLNGYGFICVVYITDCDVEVLIKLVETTGIR